MQFFYGNNPAELLRDLEYYLKPKEINKISIRTLIYMCGAFSPRQDLRNHGLSSLKSGQNLAS